MIDNKLSLRNKILLLALVPTLVGCMIFASLVWTSSRRASSMVRQSVTAFMVERTQRSLHHGYASSVVASNYLADLLRAHMKIVEHLLSTNGGVSHAGAAVPRMLVSDAEHMGGTVAMQPLMLARETITGGRSPMLEEIAQQTGDLAILFQRVDSSGSMVRVVASSPAVQNGTFLTSEAVEPGRSPGATLASGQPFVGRTMEAGEWHIGVYEPLHDARGELVGALYLGKPITQLTALQEELSANKIGSHGSVALVYAHGPQRGKVLVMPSGIGLETMGDWLSKALATSASMKDQQEEALDVHDAKSKADAIIRFSYLQRFDWILVEIADSRDLEEASVAVKDEFRSLILRSLLGSLLVLLVVALVAKLVSKRIVDPLLEITIQLTSNGTQVASSANQQLSHATSFNVSSTEIATAVKEISSTSQELLRAMEELSREAMLASAIAQEGSTGLRGQAEAIAALSKATHTISDSLDEIRNKASKINAVTMAVTKVADQTNLLSLNAAIEAEKAGDAGAGFGVVAREIRRLADQSANSSQQIEQTISEMQAAVTSAVEEVRALTVAVEQSVTVSDQIQEQFTTIISHVEAMAPRYEMVHLGMQNQSEGAQQISEAMWQLTESAGQTSEAITELNQVSLELHKAVGILKRRVFDGEVEEPVSGGLRA